MFQNNVKTYFLPRSKFATRAWFIYISKWQSDFAISRGFYFAAAKFRENKTLMKISEFTVMRHALMILPWMH